MQTRSNLIAGKVLHLSWVTFKSMKMVIFSQSDAAADPKWLHPSLV